MLGTTEVIRLQGRFDYRVRATFQDATKGAIENTSVREIHIDVGEVGFVDSAALGMLLLLRDDAKSAGKAVSITRAAEPVMDVFKIARFEKFFTFSQSAA